MHELMHVVLGMGVVMGIGIITLIATPELMVALGSWTLAAGSLLGLPTSLWYHVIPS